MFRLSILSLACVLAGSACTEDSGDDGQGGAGGIIIDTDGDVDEDDGGAQSIAAGGGGGEEMPRCAPEDFEAEMVAYCEAQFKPDRLGAECNSDEQCDSGYCYVGSVCTIRCDGDRPACPRGSTCSPAFDDEETSGCVPNDGGDCSHWTGSLADCFEVINQRLRSACSAASEVDCGDKARAYLECLGGLGQVCLDSQYDACALEQSRAEACCFANCDGPW